MFFTDSESGNSLPVIVFKPQTVVQNEHNQCEGEEGNKLDKNTANTYVLVQFAVSVAPQRVTCSKGCK